MRGELRYAHSKVYSRVGWVVFYVVLLGLLLLGVYKVLGNIKTHSLPAGEVQLIVPYSKYLVGEAITFTVKNNYNSPVYLVNDCPAEPLNVYREENGTWLRVHDRASVGDCPTENREITVKANGSVDGSFASWHNLFKIPGKYRVVAYVEYYDALPYQEFEVIAPAPVVKPAATPVKKTTKTTASPVVTPVVPTPQATPTEPTVVIPTTPKKTPPKEPNDD